MLDGLLRYGKLLALGCLLALPLLASPVTAADTAKVDAVAIVLPDPSGNATGSARDVTAKVPGKPTLEEVATELGHTKVALNFVWVLFAGFLVMFMQAGFALVETGLCRAKNATHTFFMNFAVYFVGMIGFFVCGYALQMGNAAGVSTLGGLPTLNGAFCIELFGKPFQLWGTKGFFLMGDAYDVGVLTMFLFQMVFMDTAVTIPTGAMAERWKTSNFLLFALFLSMLVYPLYANWVWGGGWLAKLGTHFGLGHGHVDFAGSSVVHMVGGVAALAGALVLGPRIGKFSKTGKPNAIPGHDIPMAILGTMILAFGWFGFNAGSTLAGNDLRIGVVAVNTMLASAAGAMASLLYMYVLTRKWDPTMTLNGFLAGLVAITAPCAFVNPLMAFLIGTVAGVLVILSCFFVERTLRLDDPVGAISVHGVNGAWGVLAVGLFADGTYGEGWNGVAGPVKGLFYGDASQLTAQFLGVATNLVWVFCTCYVFFKITDLIWGIRVSQETEVNGLDIPECGVPAYNDFTVHKS